MHGFSRSPDTTRATSQHFWGCQRSSTMDYINIPTCALFRHGTMIVRLKMEVSNSCCEPEVCPAKDCPKVVHRLSRCELCTRTRINSRISECDSGKKVEKCRPHRSSTARIRYGYACAAVCLLFLVGSLAPQSLAAPAMSNEQEDSMWANPCGYDVLNNTTTHYNPKLAKNVALQARSALRNAESYKEIFAVKVHNFNSFTDLMDDYKKMSGCPAFKVHNFNSFTDLVDDFNGYFWTQEFSWAKITLPQDKANQLKDVAQRDVTNDEYFLTVPPRSKVYGSKVSDDYLEQLMTIIGEVLPKMYKSLKAVGAAMLSVSKDQDLFNNIDNTLVGDKTLQKRLEETTFHVRNVLCVFSELMKTDKFKVDQPIPILDSEVPRYQENRKQATVVYLAALNFLEYMEQVFGKMKDTAL